MSHDSVITVDRVTKRFGDYVAVDDVTLDIGRAEFFSLLGPSGCGKTTLLRLIGGFLRPDAGRIVLDGEDITALPPNHRPTAMVFQNYALFPHMTVAENIGYALAIRKRPKAEIANRVEELLALVQLQDFDRRRPAQLSGGQQQRVALARALSLQPKVLLLDEPLSNLDANLRIQMRTEIKRLQRELQLTVVFVTHDQEEAMSISDRIMVMHQGQILQAGTPSEIYEQPATTFIARSVGAVNFLEGVLTNGTRGVASVVTPLGTFVIRSVVKGVTSGDRVCLVVRPETIRIGPPDDGAGPNRVQGRIESTMYTGALIRYSVGVGATRLAVDLHDPRHSVTFREGDPVTLTLPEDPHLLRA